MSLTDRLAPLRRRGWIAAGLALLLFAAAALLWTLQRSAEPATAFSGTPALWHVRASDGRGEAWLFGTIHILPRGVRWRHSALDAASRRADRLIVEIADSAAAPRHFAALGTAARPVALADRVPPALRARAARLAGKAGLSDHAAQYSDSWALALSLAGAGWRDLGLTQDQGVESQLAGPFRAAGKPVEGLESARAQLALFDALPEADQRALLARVIATAPRARADLERMMRAWLAGDVAALATITTEGALATPGLRAALLDQRNAAWSQAIARRIAGGQRPLVAVGAGHLAGPGNVAERLAAQGLQVTRLR